MKRKTKVLAHIWRAGWNNDHRAAYSLMCVNHVTRIDAEAAYASGCRAWAAERRDRDKCLAAMRAALNDVNQAVLDTLDIETLDTVLFDAIDTGVLTWRMPA